MKDHEIRIIWNNFTNKYKNLFMNNIDIWFDNINKLSNYIDIHSKLPNIRSLNKEDKNLISWFYNQKKYYKDNKYIMKHENIQKSWEYFNHKYNEYFI
jgi:hypothetical protein